MKRTIAVIGAHGRMGALFCREWAAKHTVFAVDRVAANAGTPALRPDDLARSIPFADTVLLCVPAPVMDEVLALVVPHMRNGATLADICSVKMLPMAAMEAAYPGPIVGTHPFFGPANNRAGASVAIVRGRNATDEACEAVSGLFRDMGCHPFLTSAEEHDRASAVSQSLHFAMSAAYFALVNKRENIAPYLTPSFKRYMNAARKELTVNADMFCEFTGANPVFPEILDEALAIVSTMKTGGLNAAAHEARAWYKKADG